MRRWMTHAVKSKGLQYKYFTSPKCLEYAYQHCLILSHLHTMEVPFLTEKLTTSTLYPKIGKLKDLVYEARKINETILELVGTVKLHGTHADIVVEDGDVLRLQSRNREKLTVESDNNGFAAFAVPLRKDLLALKNKVVARYRALNLDVSIRPECPVIMAGEWCGGNIQKKVALMQLPRHFVIVSINVNNTWVPDEDYSQIQDQSIGIYNVSNAGFLHTRLDIANVEKTETEIKCLTEQIEKECPYARTFGVSGIGEGMVWKVRSRCQDPNFWFKSKGKEFAVSERSKMRSSSLTEENKNYARHFARAIVTENRLQQGWDYLEEMQVRRDISGTGRFLKWISEDCFTEEQREIEEANISTQTLKPELCKIAKEWYMIKIKIVG